MVTMNKEYSKESQKKYRKKRKEKGLTTLTAQVELKQSDADEIKSLGICNKDVLKRALSEILNRKI